MLSATKKQSHPFGWFCFFYNEKGFEQGGRKAKPFGRKQSGGLFLPTVATSKARRERRQPRKNPLLSATKKQSHPFGWFCFFIMKRDSNKEGERQGLSEENSPVDCFLPTVATSKARRERQQPRRNPLLLP